MLGTLERPPGQLSLTSSPPVSQSLLPPPSGKSRASLAPRPSLGFLGIESIHSPDLSASRTLASMPLPAPLLGSLRFFNAQLNAASSRKPSRHPGLLRSVLVPSPVVLRAFPNLPSFLGNKVQDTLFSPRDPPVAGGGGCGWRTQHLRPSSLSQGRAAGSHQCAESGRAAESARATEPRWNPAWRS